MSRMTGIQKEKQNFFRAPTVSQNIFDIPTEKPELETLSWFLEIWKDVWKEFQTCLQTLFLTAVRISLYGLSVSTAKSK